MAVVTDTDKINKMYQESFLAWRWLKCFPRYKADYKRQVKLGKSISAEVKEELKRVYGFFPLIDPTTQSPVNFFTEIFFSYPPEPTLFPRIPSYFDIYAIERKLKIKPSELPKWVTIQLNPLRPTNIILNEIEQYLIALKKAYKIKDKRPRIDDLHEVYIIRTMKNLGVKDSVILKFVESQIKEENLKEAGIKRVSRIIKKLKSQTNKL